MGSTADSCGSSTPPEGEKQFGVTKPISMAGTGEIDHQRTSDLEYLVEAGLYESEEETAKRLEVLDEIGGKLPVESGSLDVVVSVHRAAPDLVGQQWLEEIGRVLKPGGKILLQASLAATENKLQSTLEHKLLLAGFLEVQALEDTQSLAITGKKPSWKAGSSFALEKATKTIPKLQIDEDSELIDEDSLLTEDDLKKPQLPLVGDCEVGSTRKACKNCTCGRAEEEEKVLKLGLTTEQIYNSKSACGSCGLGDAFRCSGCPYKGLPPFKLGEKIALSGNFLAADI